MNEIMGKFDRYQFHTRIFTDDSQKRYFVTLDFFREEDQIFQVPIAKQILYDMIMDCAKLEDAGYKEHPFNVNYDARWTKPLEHEFVLKEECEDE